MEPDCTVCNGTGFYVNARGIRSLVACNMHDETNTAPIDAVEAIASRPLRPKS